MSSQDERERREWTRFGAEITGIPQATIAWKQTALTTEVVNVSYGGCALEFDPPFEIRRNDRVRVTYNDFRIQAEVRHVVVKRSGLYRVGLRWISPAIVVDGIFARPYESRQSSVEFACNSFDNP